MGFEPTTFGLKPTTASCCQMATWQKVIDHAIASLHIYLELTGEGQNPFTLSGGPHPFCQASYSITALVRSESQ